MSNHILEARLKALLSEQRLIKATLAQQREILAKLVARDIELEGAIKEHKVTAEQVSDDQFEA